MKKCNLCNSEKLMESAKESQLIPGAKYVACNSCGNMMVLVNDTLIPTPTNHSAMTKVMIEDAANSFDQKLLGVSLTGGRVMEADMQPSKVQNLIAEYVNNALDAIEDDIEEEFDMDIEEECDCDEPCEICECNNTRVIVNHKNVESDNMYKDYLLVNKAGEKQLYKGCDKEFMLDIINSIGSEVKLYEVKEIKLKQEVKYNF